VNPTAELGLEAAVVGFDREPAFGFGGIGMRHTRSPNQRRERAVLQQAVHTITPERETLVVLRTIAAATAR
jgi:hypothetical protein